MQPQGQLGQLDGQRVEVHPVEAALHHPALEEQVLVVLVLDARRGVVARVGDDRLGEPAAVNGHLRDALRQRVHQLHREDQVQVLRVEVLVGGLAAALHQGAGSSAAANLHSGPGQVRQDRLRRRLVCTVDEQVLHRIAHTGALDL